MSLLMRKIERIGMAAFFLLMAVQLAWAGDFKIESDKSSLYFRIPHLMGFTVGKFERFAGTIQLNDENKALQGFSVQIEVGSVNTRQSDRDADLKSERFFDAAKFPQAQFVVKSVEPNQVRGDLTLHGVTKEVVLEYALLPGQKNDAGRWWTALTLHGTLNRKDFGITYNEQLDDGGWLLGDDVDLKIEFLGMQ